MNSKTFKHTHILSFKVAYEYKHNYIYVSIISNIYSLQIEKKSSQL